MSEASKKAVGADDEFIAKTEVVALQTLIRELQEVWSKSRWRMRFCMGW